MPEQATELLEGHELINVAGESHYQEALRELCPRTGAEEVRCEALAALVPEPDNPHDPNAVIVQIEGRLVGYLPRAVAESYGSLLAVYARRRTRATCRAVIAGRAPQGGTPNLGVFLTLPPPLERLGG